MFPALHGNGRVWIYVSNRALSENEQKAIKEDLSTFCKSWAAHGNQLAADFDVFHNQLLVLAVDENVEAATGCSIDKATAIFQEIDANLHLDLFNRVNLTFVKAGGIRIVKMQDINQAFHSGVITADSLFLDNTISSLSELRERWEVPFKDSWAFRKVKVLTS
jgi:hypothetical protein